MTDTERELIEAAMIIGSIAETAAWASDALAASIEASGKSVQQLTVAELIELRESQIRRHCTPVGA
jgi:hypothetical protein